MTTKAQTAGRLAFHDGVLITDCPLRGKRPRSLWRAGWYAARAQHRERQPIPAPTAESARMAKKLADWARENLT